ncbi:MAG TPA: DUF4190 domain-containing protein [Candidatus Pelethocola excrementipullorum]|nr:DUF4190 domain-containing protein [Candidatus Pelethocola excrementipullorum]
MSLFICPQCGKEIDANEQACPYCGLPLNQSSQGNPYQQPYHMQNQQPQGSSGLSIASMVLGILSIVFSCLGLGWILGVIGLILGIVAIFNKNQGRGMAIAGITTSAISILLIILLLILGTLNYSYTAF